MPTIEFSNLRFLDRQQTLRFAQLSLGTLYSQLRCINLSDQFGERDDALRVIVPVLGSSSNCFRFTILLLS